MTRPPAASPILGIGLMVLTVNLFVTMDAVAKYLSLFLPVLQIVWARNVFAIACTLPVLRGQRPGISLRSARPGLQLVRSGLLLASTFFFFSAIQHIPLADANAISFVSPLLVTALSVPFLGEQVGIRRWAAVVVGFVGALIIIRPGASGMQAASLLALGSSFCFAFYQIATRVLASSDNALTTALYSPLVGAIATSLVMPFVWVSPTPTQWAFLVTVGALGGLSHFVFIKAYEKAPPSMLAPFSYTQLIWSVTLGYILFDNLPDRWTLLGAATVVTSGLYTLYRESVRRRAVKASRASGT
ncbi:MAG: DMT family transporter [Alphaproteobacteria bacterium]|nr:DMT family transporter [Alphaproteobacteria bacterium]